MNASIYAPILSPRQQPVALVVVGFTGPFFFPASSACIGIEYGRFSFAMGYLHLMSFH